MELIEADSRREAAAAGAHLQGSTARKIEALRDRLLTIAAAISAYVDFPDDEIEQTGAAELSAQLRGIEEQARELLRGDDAGRIVMGRRAPTSYMRADERGQVLADEPARGGEYSIVTGAPGTTRDIVERQVSAGGVKLILQDTAGLRRARGGSGKDRRGAQSGRGLRRGARAVRIRLQPAPARGRPPAHRADRGQDRIACSTRATCPSGPIWSIFRRILNI